MIRGVLLSIFCAVGVMILHILIAQIRKPQKMFNLVFGLFIGSLALYGVLYDLSNAFWGPKTRIGFWNGVFLSVLFFLNYMQGLYYFTRPVTLRILMEFLEVPDGKLTRADLEKKYSLAHMIESRLELITLYGYAEKKEMTYRLTPKGCRFAGMLQFLRRLFGVPYYLQPVRPAQA